MPEKIENEITTPVEKETQPDKIDEFIELAKKNQEDKIDRSEYEAMRNERDRVMAALIDGQKLEKQAESIPDIAKLSEIFRNPDSTNLEVVSASLGIRQAALKKGKRDPFAPTNPTEEDLRNAQKVADVFQECVDQANGNNEDFIFYLNKHIADDDKGLLAALARKRRK